MMLRLLLLLLSLALTGCDRAAPPPGDREAIDEGYKLYELVEKTYPFHDDYELEHQLIERSEDPGTVMKFLDLKPGEVAGDIGCGSGFYSFKFQEAVGATGKVWAIDIQEQAIAYMDRRLNDPKLNPHRNIKLKLSKVDDTTLPDASLDAALFSHADFYAFPKMLDENVSMLASCFRALKPGGRMVVVQDMSIVRGSSKAIIQVNFEAAGFVLDDFHRDEQGTDLYFRFVKPGA